MDDVFGILPSWMFTAIVAVIVLLIIGIILLASIAAHLRNRHLSVPGLAGKSGDERRRYCDANLSRNYSDQYEYPKT